MDNPEPAVDGEQSDSPREHRLSRGFLQYTKAF